MTTAKAMLALESYRDAIRPVLLTSEEKVLSYRNALAGPIPSGISDISPEQLPRAISAYRLLWEIASKEGAADVIAEVMEIFPSASFPIVDKLLQPDDRMAEKVAGIRARDGFLPILTESHLSLDLRLIEAGGDANSDWMVPVITTRLVFDESIGGSTAVVFQLPLPEIDDLLEALSAIKRRISRLAVTVDASTIPVWATEGPVQ